MEKQLSETDIRGLRRQRIFSLVNFVWFGPLFWVLLRVVGGYRCRNLAAVRSQVRAARAEAQGRPILICANHLTMIDSMLLSVFLFSLSDFFRSFRLFPWNVPEYANFSRGFFLKLMCYLGKCVYIARQGSLESKRLSWSKVQYLLQTGEVVCVFPEGGRSRSGRVNPEEAVYGVGHLLLDCPDCVVLSCYLRGAAQSTYGFFPKRGDSFYLNTQLIKPETDQTGRRGARDLTLQIMESLKSMEINYFSDLGSTTEDRAPTPVAATTGGGAR